MSADRTLPLLALMLALALNARAQDGSIDRILHAPMTSDLRTRASAGYEWRPVKGIHLTIDEELRLKGMSSVLDRANTNLGAEFKVGRHLKLGSTYTFTFKEDDIRHRLAIDLTGSIKTGRWTYSLRERLQGTHYTKSFNEYQRPRNLLALKSRVKVSYSLFAKPLEPYASIEAKTILNGSRYGFYLNPESMSYSDVYLNSVRTVCGVDWRLNRSSFLDFYTMIDCIQDKKLDANKAGELKTITFKPSLVLTLGIAYRFRH